MTLKRRTRKRSSWQSLPSIAYLMRLDSAKQVTRISGTFRNPFCFIEGRWTFNPKEITLIDAPVVKDIKRSPGAIFFEEIDMRRSIRSSMVRRAERLEWIRRHVCYAMLASGLTITLLLI